MKEDIVSYITTRLSREASGDDLIYSICQKTGLSWEEAQALVERVRDEHQPEIEGRQILLKSGLSFVLYLVGIFLALGPIVYLWIMLDVTSTFLAFVSHADAETALKLFERRCAILGWLELPSIVFTMLVGVGIIVANVRYMGSIWEVIFRK
jgi:hypothetical protein